MPRKESEFVAGDSYPDNINFNHPHVYCRDGEYKRYCGQNLCNSPNVNLKNYQNRHRLEGANDVVAPSEIIVVVKYPLTHAVCEIISVQNPITRIELALVILELYKRIYKEEAETSTQSYAIPSNHKMRPLNRNLTNGIHGIWGYNLCELDLVEVIKVGYHDLVPIYELLINI